MGFTDSTQGTLIVLSLVGLAISAFVYGRLFRDLRRDGGQVRAAGFALPDLIVAIMLASFFGTLVIFTVVQPQPAVQMTVGKLLASSLTFAAIIFALGAFLFFRHLGIVATFGLTRVPAYRVIPQAALLLIGAFPVVALASFAVQQLMKDQASEQDLVQLFRNAAEQGNSRMMAAVFFTGVVMAPICEEMLFRGYFYGVGKRFIGPWASAIVTSLIFATFHGNLVSLAGLTILALALTLAYERTGSLVVPITMHALFNGTSLGLLYLQATGRLGI